MKRLAAVMLLVARITLGVLLVAGSARAEEIKMVGVVTHIELAGKDATTATATLKDGKTEQPVDITINDDLTLDKLKDHRIVEGDEIRCKYEVKEGKNVSTYFRKTAGC